VLVNNRTGTVDGSALFTEELLPSETVMYSLVMSSKIFLDEKTRHKSETVKAAADDEGAYLLDTIGTKIPDYIQIGGDATIGKGICRVTVGV